MWGSAALSGVTGAHLGQHSRPGDDRGLMTGVKGAGGGDGVPGITQASVMSCSSASVNLLRASAAGSHKVLGTKPRQELPPIRSSFQVRFPYLDLQRTQLADVCVRNQQLRRGKVFFMTGKRSFLILTALIVLHLCR